jgi:hypothetical protein
MKRWRGQPGTFPVTQSVGRSVEGGKAERTEVTAVADLLLVEVGLLELSVLEEVVRRKDERQLEAGLVVGQV